MPKGKKKAEKKENVKEMNPVEVCCEEGNCEDCPKPEPIKETKKPKAPKADASPKTPSGVNWGKLAGQCAAQGITITGDESVDTLKQMLNA